MLFLQHSSNAMSAPLIIEEAGFNLVPAGIFMENFSLIRLPSALNMEALRPWEIEGSTEKPKYQLLYFWTPECKSCEADLLQLNIFHTGKKIPDNLKIIPIAFRTDLVTAANFISQNALSIPNYLDEEGHLATRLGVLRAPTSYIVDAKGELIARQTGIMNFHSSGVEILLAKLSAKNKEKVPSNASLPSRDFLAKELMTSSQSSRVNFLEIPLFGWFSLGFLAIVCYSACRSIKIHRRHLRRLRDEKRASHDES